MIRHDREFAADYVRLDRSRYRDIVIAMMNALLDHRANVVRRAMAYFTSSLDANGLYSTPPGSINWHPFDTAPGEDTHTNSVVYRALMDGADLEGRLGAGPGAAAADTRAAAWLRAAMLARLWDPSSGAFLLNASDPMRNHTEGFGSTPRSPINGIANITRYDNP